MTDKCRCQYWLIPWLSSVLATSQLLWRAGGPKPQADGRLVTIVFFFLLTSKVSSSSLQFFLTCIYSFFQVVFYLGLRLVVVVVVVVVAVTVTWWLSKNIAILNETQQPTTPNVELESAATVCSSVWPRCFQAGLSRLGVCSTMHPPIRCLDASPHFSQLQWLILLA